MNFNLNRFIIAQENMFDCALKEIQAGKKTSHWMWFIFPQIKGLGSSTKANFYGIENLEEAKEYLCHPILGKRLLTITNAFYNINGMSAEDILGSPDHLKLQSCMTLFALADASEHTIFLQVLKKYYNTCMDKMTLNRLCSEK